MSDVAIREVSYRYRRDADALRDVTLDVPSGAILGLLGANGAGKTTLLQCCAGLRTPDAGRVLIGGADSAQRALIVRGVVGYVAAGLQLPRDLTLHGLERWIAPLHRRWDPDLASSLRERFGLDGTRRLTTLSRGEYMKAALLCALSAQPRVLLMDEPLSGIDAVSRDETPVVSSRTRRRPARPFLLPRMTSPRSNRCSVTWRSSPRDVSTPRVRSIRCGPGIVWSR